MAKKISYATRDFAGIRQELVNLTKEYYPDFALLKKVLVLAKGDKAKEAEAAKHREAVTSWCNNYGTVDPQSSFQFPSIMTKPKISEKSSWIPKDYKDYTDDNKEQVEEIVKTYPTPFYLYDEKQIRENVRKVLKAFA